ncbi:signal transduction histidine kinase [Deinobacterium chartae]|uniref:histidine kinase n=1 Tax=Deinobacterium chartae TaxID=521158 RepID=A0A841I045_9DEIO|nr:HAMP domain-containing sensor histidine kinase [Deinobacterium chartae]MBB6098486.1 signal transduction histidine kinase [Deinobacterium chartae]
MRLFARLFLSHLLVLLVAEGTLLLAAELLASGFFRHHVDEMVRLIGPRGAALRPDLEAGMRGTLTGALLASLPIATLLAALTALLASRRVVRSVQLLERGSREIAAGHFERRLPETGRDELTDLARSFNRMAASLERVEESRAELIGNVGHELRSPLAALRGYAEALVDGVMTPEQAGTAILREVRAMDRLAGDLSAISRIEAGRVELHPVDFSAADLLRAAFERFEAAFEERGVRLELRAAALPVRADFERSLQVLSNLLSNALRHTPPGGQVSVRVRGGRGEVRFEVTDSGPGIPAEHLERIFERFYRVDAARSRQAGGSGVGLTIARGLARAMDGQLTVTSGPQGSTFTLRLPAGV